MVRCQDLQILDQTLRKFDATGNVHGLKLGPLQVTCQRILASDPFQPLAWEVIRLIDHAAELRALED